MPYIKIAELALIYKTVVFAAENIKSTSCKNKLRQKTPLRTPFTDITNKIPRTNDDRDKAKAKYKMRGNARLKYLGRNLLDDELSKNQTASAIVDDENCGMTSLLYFSI